VKARRPAFARDFPDDPGLARLVDAFARGNYRAVKDGVPALVANTDNDAVRAAATELLARTRPDPAAKIFFGLTLAVVLALSGWWIWHGKQPHPPPEPRQIEYVR
jgi:hypothetical protein